MGIFDWFASRKLKREDKAINQIISLLEGEADEVKRLKDLLLLIKTKSNIDERYSLYLRFEKELKKFEQFAGIIDGLDSSILKKTMFARLKERQ